MRRSQFVALGGVLTAASLALLCLASVLPVGQAGVCAVAGILPIMPLSHGRVSLAVMVYTAAILLGWLIVPLKSIVFVYSVFGLYAFVKRKAEGLRHRSVEWFCKLAYCNGCLLGVAFLLIRGFFADIPFQENRVVLFAWFSFNLMFIAFDIALSKAIGLLQRAFPKK